MYDSMDQMVAQNKILVAKKKKIRKEVSVKKAS